MRGETQFKQKFPRLELFQSTLPMRGETSMVYRLTIRFPRFQSTLPMRGETTRRKCSGSIFEISIHSPHAGRDSSLTLHRTGGTIFQSTLPMRGETATTYITCRPRLFQSTLPMRGETRDNATSVQALTEFQSTLPMRGETNLPECITKALLISIHSPHAGRD